MPALSPFDWDVRAACYRLFIEHARAPEPAELAGTMACSEDQITVALCHLVAHHQLVLAPGEGKLWMLHPFSAIPTEYPVESGGKQYWANCAWDSLSIPAVLGTDSWTRTRCGETGTAVEYGVRAGVVEGDDVVVHFAVPPKRFYENIAFT